MGSRRHISSVPPRGLQEAVERMIERLRAPVNARETRWLHVPEEPLEFFGYRVTELAQGHG